MPPYSKMPDEEKPDSSSKPIKSTPEPQTEKPTEEEDLSNLELQEFSNEILEDFQEILEPLLKHIPDEERAEVFAEIGALYLSTKVKMEAKMSYSGPLPLPSMLKQYDEVVPGSAERILSVFEEQAKHRQAMEKTAQKRSFNQSTTGQWMAFIIAMCFLGGSIFIAATTQPYAGAAMGGTTIVGLVVAFIKGRNSKEPLKED